MSVLFVSEFTDLESPRVAFARRTHAHVRELRRLGVEVVVATLDASADREHSPTPGPLVLTPHRFQRALGRTLPGRLIMAVAVTLRFCQWLVDLRPSNVVIAFHNPVHALPLVLLSRVFAPSVLFDIHDSWLVLEHEHPGRLRNGVRKLLERVAVHAATKVTTVSPTLKRLLGENYRLSPGKVAVVFNGADPLPERPRGTRDIDLLHLGSPRPYYDTLSLVESLGRLAAGEIRPTLVFLGCTDEPYVDDVRRRVRELGLADQVRFHPPVPTDQVASWLARARLGVQTISQNPIYRCAIGAKIFEYLAHGVPILHLGPADGETARLIGSAGCGRVVSNVEGLPGAIGELLSDPVSLESLADAAHRVAASYSWENSGRSLAAALGLAEVR